MEDISNNKQLTTMSSTTNTVYTASSLITMLPTEPSICIPRVFMNIQKERIYDVFADLFGRNAIERVDMIERKNDAGEEYKRAFVHFKSWPRTEQATEVRLKLLNGDEVKIMYDQPWFWRISASRVPRPEDVQRENREHRDESRPFIVLDEEKTKDTRRAPYQPRRQAQQAPREQQYRDEQRRQPERQDRQHQDRQQHHQSRHYQERYDEHRDQRDYRPHPQSHHYQERYDERRGGDRYEPRRQQQQPRTHQHPREQHHRPQQHQERYERSSYNHRLDSRRPPAIEVTSASTPEIADWIEKSNVPGAPVKGKKPKLVIDEEDVAEVESKTSARKLEFDEMPSTPPTSPVHAQSS